MGSSDFLINFFFGWYTLLPLLFIFLFIIGPRTILHSRLIHIYLSSASSSTRPGCFPHPSTRSDRRSRKAVFALLRRHLRRTAPNRLRVWAVHISRNHCHSSHRRTQRIFYWPLATSSPAEKSEQIAILILDLSCFSSMSLPVYPSLPKRLHC
jgi:hypothetical protein